MVGTQRPKSRPAMVEATKPVNVPVTAFETAPKPTDGEVQRRVEPEPVHVPAAAVLEELVLAAVVSTAAAEVATEATSVEAAC